MNVLEVIQISSGLAAKYCNYTHSLKEHVYCSFKLTVVGD